MRELSRDPTFDNDTEAIKDHLKQGKLLPTEMILPILQQKMDKEKAKGHHHFLIDGFPRKVSQGIEFEKQVRILNPNEPPPPPPPQKKKKKRKNSHRRS